MKSYMARRVQTIGKSVFAEMTALANQYQAVNLGQGFPDFPAPDFIKEAAQQAIVDNINQYAPSIGRSRLRTAIAKEEERRNGRSIDPNRNILVTHGATEALFAIITSLVDEGDEVIMFEPYYDSYVPNTEMAGGIPRFYTLRPPQWEIDLNELEALFSAKTKLIIINTPHNPTGKLFSKTELEGIAHLCQKYDVLALVDQVYEHIIFDHAKHYDMASIDGMADRTLLVSSAGKTFSVTGWKVGWIIAHPLLIDAVGRSHQFTTFSGAAPLQEATAVALEVAPQHHYYQQLAETYQQKRDFLCQALAENGLKPLTPAGTYFVMADISPLGFPDDVAFCRFLTKEIGVAAIPPSAFFHNPSDGATIARFAFCKEDKTLQQASQHLQKLRQK